MNQIIYSHGVMLRDVTSVLPWKAVSGRQMDAGSFYAEHQSSISLFEGGPRVRDVAADRFGFSGGAGIQGRGG